MPYYQQNGKTRNCFEALQSLQAIKINNYLTEHDFVLYKAKPLPILQEGRQCGLAAQPQGSQGGTAWEKEKSLSVHVTQGR